MGSLIMMLGITNEASRVGMHSTPCIPVLLFGAVNDMAEKDLKSMGLSISTTVSRLDFILLLFIFLNFFFPEDSLLPHLVLLLPWSVSDREAAMK